MDSQQIAREILEDLCQLLRGPVHSVQGISGGEIGTLIYTNFNGGVSTPTAISQEMGISTARVANVLNSLEKKGYVLRSHDSTDRRRVLVRVTEKGRDLAERYAEDVVNQARTVLEALGEQDAAEVRRLLRRIRQVCDEKWAQAPENLTGGVHT